ncbi:hypothetical protein D9613_009785 [Agrocybe pediades]|uniref:F-box domain-containing protein n=1 Tax=Agrocybe pediades TaxID=84607 RepID=A0A8H4VT17_9AGAR|nr:hypothetical protein D9613_009785 [Agrocybe pediades]
MDSKITAMAMREAASILTLGLDLLVSIACSLRPPDILSLRQTCKTLQAATTPIVWLHALRQMLEEHCIPEQTFPLESMTTRQLQRLALTPARFSWLIGSPAEVNPTHIRVLPDFAISNEDASVLGLVSWEEYMGCSLIPGGRYLFVFQKIQAPTMKTSLHVWDLGIRGYNDNTKVVLRTLLGDHVFQPLRLFPVSGGGGTYLVGIEEADVPSLAVQKITTYAQNPVITLVNRHIIQDEIVSLTVSGTRMAYLNVRSVLVVWDFVEDKSARWESFIGVDDDHKSEKTICCKFQIHIYEDTVMVHRSGELILWKIPPLRPHDQSGLVPNERSFTLTSLFGVQAQDYGQNVQDDLSTVMLPQNPSIDSDGIDTIAFLNRDRDTFCTKWIQPMLKHLSNEVSLPGVLPINGPTILGSPEFDNAQLSALRRCNDYILTSFLSHDSSALNIFMFPPAGPKSPSGNSTPASVSACKAIDVNFFKLSITRVETCVATGRMCVMTEESIFVMDFA